MPCMVLSLYNIVKKFVFFQGRKDWCSFHKFPDFSCRPCEKKVLYSAFVWKYTYMCKYRFGVQLFQNPPLCSNTQTIPTTSFSFPRCFQILFDLQIKIYNRWFNSKLNATLGRHLNFTPYAFQMLNCTAFNFLLKLDKKQKSGAELSGSKYNSFMLVIISQVEV
jgi:hypothetical protein